MTRDRLHSTRCDFVMLYTVKNQLHNRRRLTSEKVSSIFFYIMTIVRVSQVKLIILSYRNLRTLHLQLTKHTYNALFKHPHNLIKPTHPTSSLELFYVLAPEH